MPVRLTGSTSGYTELDAPAVAGNNTIKMPASNGAAGQRLGNGATAGTLEYSDNIVSGTAQASTSGTSIDFTGIPSWVKRITVMLNGVSTNGASVLQVQLGAGSVTTTGYAVSSGYYGAGQTGSTATSGFVFSSWSSSANLMTGMFTFCLLGSNTWIGTGIFVPEGQAYQSTTSGKIALSGTLDRIRITTVNGTDTFDAGTINILYE